MRTLDLDESSIKYSGVDLPVAFLFIVRSQTPLFLEWDNQFRRSDNNDNNHSINSSNIQISKPSYSIGWVQFSTFLVNKSSLIFADSKWPIKAL